MRMKHVIKFLEIIYVLNMDLMFTSGRRIISPQNDFLREKIWRLSALENLAVLNSIADMDKHSGWNTQFMMLPWQQLSEKWKVRIKLNENLGCRPHLIMIKSLIF